MWTLYPHQSDAINQISKLYAQGESKILYQLATGGGKTVTFAGMVQRYMSKFSKKVLVLVHREKLLDQTRKTLYNGFEIHAVSVSSKVKNLPYSQVYVAMVETANNRLKRSPNYFGDVGMVIVDECHIGNFNKIYQYFDNALIVGFSATPIASRKKDPLKNYFDNIVAGPPILDLIHMGKLCQNETYSIRGMNRSKLKVKRGEFDSAQMGSEYSKSKNVMNTVQAYERLGEHQKTIVFNCNKEHGKLVNNTFIEMGYNSRYLDSDTKNRKEMYAWFKNTPNAILNNIDVATTGFDEPSLINVIVNRSTKSLPLWLQMTGRGARIYPGKDFFRIIDMGGNALEHGDWREHHNWEDIFINPDKPSKGDGVAPIKSCEGCEALIPASTRYCKLCGHHHENIIEYDLIAPEFEKLVGRINVQQLIEIADDNNHKPWKPFFEILKKTMTTLQYRIGDLQLTKEVEEQVFLKFDEKVKEWFKLRKKRYVGHHRKFVRERFDEAILKLNKVPV